MIKLNDKVLHEDSDTNTTFIKDWSYENIDNALTDGLGHPLPEVIDVKIDVKSLYSYYVQPDFSSWESPEDYYGGWQVNREGFIAKLYDGEEYIGSVDAESLFDEDELEGFLTEFLIENKEE